MIAALAESEWPTKKEFSPPPQEERRKDVVTVAAVLKSTDPRVKYRKLSKVHDIFGCMLQAIQKWKTFKWDNIRKERGLLPQP
jgi:hypothetical protein